MLLSAMCSLSEIANSIQLDNYEFDDFYFKCGQNQLDGQLFDSYFIQQAGEIQCRQFIDRPYIATIFEVDEDTNIPLFNRKYFTMLNQFIGFLWFSKDNSVNLHTLYTYVQVKKRLFLRNKLAQYSNSEGEYKPVEFAATDFDLAKNIFNKLLSKAKNYDLKVNFTDEENVLAKVAPSHYNYINYNQHPRIEKALSFLNIGRSQAFMPLKIAMYISSFECLFTTDNIGVSHKTAERAAFYLGGESETLLSNHKIIKKAYDFRSSYLHGQNLEKNKDSYEFLREISIKLDGILRKILKKIILHDSELFEKNKNEIDDYFTTLIFDKR